MLSVANLECMRGDRRLFSGLSFRLAAGEILHVKGKNGSGKTTLLRAVAGLVLPEAGEIRWGDGGAQRLEEEFLREILYFGHLNGVKDELTPFENLQIHGALRNMDVSEAHVAAVLKRMGLRRCYDLPVKVLSQGQKKRVALARLLIESATLWILDEPFTALDVSAVELLQSMLLEHVERGGMVILTTHQEMAIGSGRLQTIELGTEPGVKLGEAA